MSWGADAAAAGNNGDVAFYGDGEGAVWVPECDDEREAWGFQ